MYTKFIMEFVFLKLVKNAVLLMMHVFVSVMAGKTNTNVSVKENIFV